MSNTEPKQDVSRETQEDGKEVITTKHEDGRQDVEIKVNRLNIENRTPEDTIAEEAIIKAMSKKMVRVIVVHKPTNDSTHFECPLPLVRKRAEEVVQAYNKMLAEKLGVAGAEAPKSEFVVVEVDGAIVRVSSL